MNETDAFVDVDYVCCKQTMQCAMSWWNSCQLLCAFVILTLNLTLSTYFFQS